MNSLTAPINDSSRLRKIEHKIIFHFHFVNIYCNTYVFLDGNNMGE